jgi:hypothetical protein
MGSDVYTLLVMVRWLVEDDIDAKEADGKMAKIWDC